MSETLTAAKCPECRGNIFVKIGLTAESADCVVKCPTCKHVVALAASPALNSLQSFRLIPKVLARLSPD
jgi:hypothetical protein